MKNPLIKVCGMRDAENINAVEALGVNMIGLIFYKKSPRFVGMIDSGLGMLPDYSKERLEEANFMCEMPDADSYCQPLRSSLGTTVKRVGVFVDEMPQTIVTYIYNYKLDYVQLHGHESPTLIENMKRTLIPDIAPNIQFIKAFSISQAADLEQCRQYEGVADMFLFDTAADTPGGTGQQFDWSVLQAYDGETPFLLSGGIGPDDVEAILAFDHPRCVGIDVNSRFETSPAMKDVARLRTFVEQLR